MTATDTTSLWQWGKSMLLWAGRSGVLSVKAHLNFWDVP